MWGLRLGGSDAGHTLCSELQYKIHVMYTHICMIVVLLSAVRTCFAGSYDTAGCVYPRFRLGPPNPSIVL